MDARKRLGRSALPTPTTALSKVCNPNSTDNAANEQRGADALIGTALRHLRRFVALRLQGARPARCLKELACAADALSSAIWAMEHEAGLGQRGER
jgi:hypothetical protein